MTLADISLFAPLIQAATTLIVGAAVSFVAFRQWQTAKEKLALDLFDKRFALYKVITDSYFKDDLYPIGASEHKADIERIENAVQTAAFLFDRSLIAKLQEALNLEDGTLKDQIIRSCFKEMGRYMRFDRPHRQVD